MKTSRSHRWLGEGRERTALSIVDLLGASKVTFTIKRRESEDISDRPRERTERIRFNG